MKEVDKETKLFLGFENILEILFFEKCFLGHAFFSQKKEKLRRFSKTHLPWYKAFTDGYTLVGDMVNI